ncbi:hypothetical protein EON65_05470 [archaeon]|nr:MAG: hypothetical protein EON65_05470 [archaeon]
MMPVNKSLTLEKLRGREDREDDVNEAALLAQILRRLQLSDMKLSKSLNVISRTQNNLLQTVQQQQQDAEEA